MDIYLVIYYVALFAICLTLGYTLCRTFAAEARIYLAKRFNGDEPTYNSMLRLFCIGFWLIHAGIGLFVLIAPPYLDDAGDVAYRVGLMVGWYALIMALYNYLLMRLMYQVKV